MKYIESLREGTRVSTVYLCRTKQTLLTKTGKEYFSLLLQDKTGTVDGKIWDPGNPGIGEFDAPDYIRESTAPRTICPPPSGAMTLWSWS